MDDKKYEKWAALAGVVFVVLALAGGFIAGSPPKVSDPDGKIVKFTKDNEDALKIASYLGGLGIAFFLFFLGAVGSRLRQAGSGRLAATAVMGGVATASIAAIGFSISGYGALHPLESAGTFRLSTVVMAMLGFAAFVFTEATSIVIVRSKFLPAWLGWFGGLVALLWLVGAAAVSTEDDTIFAMGFVAFIAWALWMLVLSVMLFRTTDTAAAA